MSSKLEVVSFVLARAAELEADAPHVHDMAADRASDGICGGTVGTVCGYPDRMLRLAEAVRNIAEIREEVPGFDLPEGVHDGRDPDERERDEDVACLLDDVLGILATIWSDHEDCQPESMRKPTA